jgi:hypothetical protein
MMVCLLLYAYCEGMSASRKIAQACERNLTFRAIGGAARPDFRPIHDFRQLPLAAFCDVFVAVLRLAGESGLGQRGTVSTDGTTLPGNTSRHKAMSYGSMQKAVARLREAIAASVTQASQQDAADDAALGSRRGDEWLAELARREDWLATIAAAMPRREARAKVAADATRPRPGTQRRGRAPTEGTRRRRTKRRCADRLRVADHADEPQRRGLWWECASQCG